MTFKFYKTLRDFSEDNPKHFIVPTLKKNLHFYDIDCNNIILDGDSITIDTASETVRIEKDSIAYLGLLKKKTEIKPRTKENLLDALGLLLG